MEVMENMMLVVLMMLVVMVLTTIALTITVMGLRKQVYKLESMLDITYDITVYMKKTLPIMHDSLDDIEEACDAIQADVSTIFDKVCCTKPGDGDEFKPCKDDEQELDIHLIKPEEYYFENQYDPYALVYNVKFGELRYYTSKLLFVDIENVKELVGDGLMFFGINANEPNVVYVRNHKMQADFRIERVGYEGKENDQ